jgi:hypothetical protein
MSETETDDELNPITRWYDLFFWNWINLNPSDHCVELFSLSHVASISFTSTFALISWAVFIIT